VRERGRHLAHGGQSLDMDELGLQFLVGPRVGGETSQSRGALLLQSSVLEVSSVDCLEARLLNREA
jgi:hypothetical protein